MYKEYEKSFKKPQNGVKVTTDIALVRHLKNGMDASKFSGSITVSNDVVSIHIPEKKLSVSIPFVSIENAIFEFKNPCLCNTAEKQGDKCLGLCHSENDDEPIDVCKTCMKYVSFGEE